MNTEQAKFILHGYRSNGADAGDATFAEALEHVRHDAGLAEWLAKSVAFDRAVSAHLSTVQPPAGLREAILAGGRVTVPDQTKSRKGWSRPAWVGLAASIALMGGLALSFWPQALPADASLRDYVLADARGLHGHRNHGQGEEALQAQLSDSTAALQAMRPEDFTALRDKGCRTLKFQGHEVLEVCFQRNGTWFHCYIARREDFPTTAATWVPALTEHGRVSLASWADTTYLYVIVSKTGRTALEKIL